MIPNLNDTELQQSSKQMDHFSEEIYNYLYGQLISRMAYYLVLGIVVVFGPFLGMLMVLFERFGADSQKRTIINRLCSFVFINISIMSFTWSTLRILRDNFGLLTSKIFDPLAIIYLWLSLSTSLFITEITVFRFLYIVVWRRMKVINDEFWTTVLSKSTYLTVFYVSVMCYVLGGPGSFHTGQIVNVMPPQNNW